MAHREIWQFDQKWIKRWIIVNRERHNKNNCTRTNFYLEYWDKHREVPWTLIAHIVSRNAGYQMSDLIRLRSFLRESRNLKTLVTWLLSERSVDHLFAFLEAGNFLIFYDVFPQITAYAWAKHFYIQTGKDYSANLFDMLADDDFGVDHFIIEEWKGFFAEAKRASWWENNPNIPLQDSIARHTLALVANEQNYIEERLVNPGILKMRYLDAYQQMVTRKFIQRMNKQGFPRLVIIEADPQDKVRPSYLLLYPVHRFVELESRIEIGRQLYRCIFRQNSVRASSIQAWVTIEKNKVHRGTRTDYDDACFSIYPPVDESRQQIYSPPLIRYENQQPAWPTDPGKDARFYKVHEKPILLPSWSRKFTKQRIEHWLDWNVKCEVMVSTPKADRTPIEVLI